MAASPRHRFLAYAPYLAGQGIHLEFSPLLDDDYLSKKLNGRSASVGQVIGAYIKRLLKLTEAKRYDLLIIHCELLPYFPAWCERVLARLNVPYVFDYDDAIFHMYDDHKSSVVRTLLSNKIAHVISGARAVMAGSQYLADYAKRYNENVHVVPTVVDLERYRVKDWESRGDGPFTVGWIGSPSTVRHLMLVQEALEALSPKTEVRLVVVGATPAPIKGVEIETHQWTEETEVGLLLQCDVGIMPLHDEPFTRGKCAFKLIQYMACALPTVSSPVGANVDVVTKETGFYAANTDQWLQALTSLSENASLRSSLGNAGRRRCEEEFSLTSQSASLTSILLQAVAQDEKSAS